MQVLLHAVSAPEVPSKRANFGARVASEMAKRGCGPVVRRVRSAGTMTDAPNDWPALVTALLMHKQRDGKRLGTRALAILVGCDHSRISRLRQPGTEPLHSFGVRLERLHIEWIGPPPKLVPKVNR